jgi:hypothetical protein
MKVWSYWEGPRPEYIKICIESMARYCPSFTLITPDNVREYLSESDINPVWRMRKEIAHRADCARVAIINKFGGLWVDCDTVFIRPIDQFKSEVEGFDFVYSRWKSGEYLNGYFYGSKGNPVAGEWLAGINAFLKTGKPGEWTSLGEKILGPIMRSGKYSKSCKEIDRRTFIPINIALIPHVFFEPVHYSSFITDDTVAVGLNHSWFFKFFQSEIITNKEPWKGDGLINTLLRDAR